MQTLKCEAQQKHQSKNQWLEICRWCLKSFCDSHVNRKKHECQGEYDVYKEDIAGV